ncbi:hypothetical protein BDR05DRAFT_1040799 [Suillus weaverae]|nr:hypothetical protein BDR05DRAFT_1040799 [Suillus weaverae]
MDLQDTNNIEQAAAGFVSILGLRQSSREEVERSCTCPTLRASRKEARVKKKKTTNSSRHGLSEFDFFDVGKRSKQASDVPESGITLGNALIIDGHIIERPPCHGGAKECPPVLLNFGTVFLAEQIFWTVGLVEKCPAPVRQNTSFTFESARTYCSTKT